MARKNPHKGIRGWPKDTPRSKDNCENIRRGWKKRRSRTTLERNIVLERGTADDFLALADLKKIQA
jgi:hypothetical protein